MNDFGYGPTSEIGVTKQMEFPYLWVTHRNTSEFVITNRTLVPRLNFTFIIVDQINIQKNYQDVNGLDSDNQQEIISDTLQYAQDFVGYIVSEFALDGIKISDDSVSLEAIFDETDDKVTGWVLDLSIQLPHSNCAKPIK